MLMLTSVRLPLATVICDALHRDGDIDRLVDVLHSRRATRAVDDQQLLAIEGSQKVPWEPRHDVQSGRSPKNTVKTLSKPHRQPPCEELVERAPRIRVHLHVEKSGIVPIASKTDASRASDCQIQEGSKK